METKAHSEFLANRGLKIALGVGAAAAAIGICYFLFRSKDDAISQKDERHVAPIPNPSRLKVDPITASNDQAYENAIRRLRPIVKAEIAQGRLNANTIMEINQALTIICSRPFAVAILDNRRKRRSIRESDKKAYVELIKSGTIAIEKLVQETQLKVLLDLKCPKEIFEQSSAHWAQVNPNFAIASLLMIERMKAGIDNKGRDLSTLDLAKAREMMSFQLEEYPKIDIEVSEPGLLPLVKANWIADLVKKKFGFEEEDMTKIQNLSQDGTFRELAMKLQAVIQQDAGVGF